METIDGIMELVTKEDLEGLATRYGVNRYNTKLTGELIFKGLMRLILLGKKTSLRMLETLINEGINHFEPTPSVSYSGISKRLKDIKWRYFEAIYQRLVNKLSLDLGTTNERTLHRFDSTIINLSGRLIKDGLKIGGKASDSQIKVSVGLRQQLPTSIRFCTLQEESSEDLALVRAINEARVDREDILLFDRGISKAGTFGEFEAKEYKFITRLNVGRRHHVVKTHSTGTPDNILEDLTVSLYAKGSKTPLPTGLRLIKLLNKEGNELWFLTNLFDMSALEITELYRRRWDIEVFFKFIKQNLGYKHFLSHSMNGMRVYIYMVLITALVFLAYKIKTKLQGFKIPLFRFNLALEKSFVKSMILLSGGNFDAVKHLF
ncbi:MAG: IS4 family transposase [Alphaproteobacteria bacterium]|nr:IS4 family transposase [Alphaproteobacteria bacterium]